MGRLEGTGAVVTGGTSGIGLATAKSFVAEAAYVFLTGRRAVELNAAVEQIGRHVAGVQGSLTRAGAPWLEWQCICGLSGAGRDVVIDPTEVTFLDEAGTVVLRHLRQYPAVSLVGCQLFTQHQSASTITGSLERHEEMAWILRGFLEGSSSSLSWVPTMELRPSVPISRVLGRV
jgi:hypothetical protein